MSFAAQFDMRGFASSKGLAHEVCWSPGLYEQLVTVGEHLPVQVRGKEELTQAWWATGLTTLSSDLKEFTNAVEVGCLCLTGVCG